MKIQNINTVSESLKSFVKILRESEATSEAMTLLGNLDPEFKEDADYLRELLGIVETAAPTVTVVEEAPIEVEVVEEPEPEEEPEVEIIPEQPVIITEPIPEPEVNEKRHYNWHINAENLKIQYPDAYSYAESLNSISLKDYPETFRKFITTHPDSKCGRNYFYKILRKIYPPTSDETNEAEEWRRYPADPRIMISSLGHAKFNGEDCKPTMNGTYLTIEINKNGAHEKSVALARAVLETFVPVDTSKRRIVPVYKDGDHRNVRLSNLEWGFNASTVFPEQIHEACRIIAENPRLSVPKLGQLMAKMQKGVGTFCLKSILAGKYSHISDKYFTYLDGKIVPLANRPTTTPVVSKPAPTPAPKVSRNEESDKTNTAKIIDMIENNKGNIVNLFIMTKDLELAVKLFETKKDLNMYLTELDKMIPVLEFINEGVENTSEILKKIHEKYGYIFITSKRIEEIKTKRFHKEISSLVF